MKTYNTHPKKHHNTKRMKPWKERFWSKVDKTSDPDGCWLWTGGKMFQGYGNFGLNGKTKKAHRLAYMILKGPIPNHTELDHLCRHPSCVNPSHLEAVTHQVNIIRGHAARETINGKRTCKHGHPKEKTGPCKTCNRVAQARWKAKNPEANAAMQYRYYLKTKRPNCIHGHPLTDDNIIRGGDGRRLCRTCREKKQRNHRQDR